MFKSFAMLACIALLAPLDLPRRSIGEGVEGGGLMFAHHSLFGDGRVDYVDYIFTRNGGCFDSGIAPSASTVIEAEIMIFSNQSHGLWTGLFGSRSLNGARDALSCFRTPQVNPNYIGWSISGGYNDNAISLSGKRDTWGTLSISLSGVSFMGVNSSTPSTNWAESSLSLFICGINENGHVLESHGTDMGLKWVRISDNGGIKGYFLPAVFDGAGCLYDKVAKRYVMPFQGSFTAVAT